MQSFYEEVENVADEALKAIYQEDLDKAKELLYSLIIRVKMIKKLSLAENKVEQRTYNSIDQSTRHNMHVVGYCFSKFGHACLYPELSQDSAFNLAAKKIGVKKSTLKQTRDAFDGHNDSPRRGYWQTDLPNALQKIKNKYDRLRKEVVISEAKKILCL